MISSKFSIYRYIKNLLRHINYRPLPPSLPYINYEVIYYIKEIIHHASFTVLLNICQRKDIYIFIYNAFAKYCNSILYSKHK